MSDIYMTPLGGKGTRADRFLLNEGMPGIKKCSIKEEYSAGYIVTIFEFPEIGHSLLRSLILLSSMNIISQ